MRKEGQGSSKQKQKSLEGMVKKLQVKIQVIGEAITQIIEKRNKKYTTSLLSPGK